MRYFLLRLKRFCGFVTGFVFFISGILKLMDPVGASLVMKEYFNFLHMGFLEAVSKPTGILFALAETIIGTGLITGVWRRITARLAIGLQGFFTMLTLSLVIFNPVMDCGCFGEAIHLTHGETFVKNLVLMALLLTYYIPERHLGGTRRRKYVSFGVVTLSVCVFAIYSLRHLPLNDYTEFHSGVSLNAEDSASDMYEAVFIYEKEGKQETFDIESLPDSSWTFIRTETIHKDADIEETAVLSFYDQDGNYADSLLYDGNVVIMSVYDTDIKDGDRKTIVDFISEVENSGARAILLSSSPLEGLPSYIADYKTLITLNRSNCGATYIHDGILIRKWSKKSLPDSEELAKIIDEDITEAIISNSRSSLAFQGFLLYVFAVMLLL